MKARDYNYTSEAFSEGMADDLVAFLETDEGMSIIKEHDDHWNEVMQLAEEHGFIIEAYGGAARISTNEAYAEANGLEALAKRLRMCNIEMGGDQV